MFANTLGPQIAQSRSYVHPFGPQLDTWSVLWSHTISCVMHHAAASPGARLERREFCACMLHCCGTACIGFDRVE